MHFRSHTGITELALNCLAADNKDFMYVMLNFQKKFSNQKAVFYIEYGCLFRNLNALHWLVFSVALKFKLAFWRKKW